MRSHPGVAARFFEVLSRNNIDLKMVFVACAFAFHITLADLVTLVGMHLNIEQIADLQVQPFVTHTTITFVNITSLLHP